MEAILGGPPGNYFPGEPMDWKVTQCQGRCEEWLGKELIVVVGFGDDGRAIGKGTGYVMGYSVRPGWWERFRAWAGL